MKDTTVSLFEKLVNSLCIFLLICVLGFPLNGKNFETNYPSQNNSRDLHLLAEGGSPNSPPNPNGDNYTVHGNFQSSPASVLDNDSDPDGDALHVVSGSLQTSLGFVGFYYYGNVTFSPSYGATGTTTVPYTVCDSHNACSTSTVTFNVVNQAPVAVSDSYTIHRTLDTLSANLPGVLANDTDPEGDSLSVRDANGNYLN